MRAIVVYCIALAWLNMGCGGEEATVGKADRATALTSRSQGAAFNDGELEYVEYFETNKLDFPVNRTLTAKDTSGRPITVKIKSRNIDELAGDGQVNGVFVYTIVRLDGARELPLCQKNYDRPHSRAEEDKPDKLLRLNQTAFIVPGYWDHKTGEYVPYTRKQAVTISCISGVVGKCAHWGYMPGVGYKDTPDMINYHIACVKAARAQYVPNSVRSFTCNRTLIDIYDRLGIQRLDTSSNLPVFEATWNEGGIVRLQKPRFGECDGEVDRCDQAEPGGKCGDPADDWANPKFDGVLIGTRSNPYFNNTACPGRAGKPDPCD